MKRILFALALTLLAFCLNAQIQVEEAKPKTTNGSQYVTPFDSTKNTMVYGTDISSYIGKELFFLYDLGDFFSDSLAEHSLHLNPQLKYYIFLDKVYVPSQMYYDSYRQVFVEKKSKFLYKINEKGTDDIVWFNPDLDNPLMPGETAFSLYSVIWVSYYNYLKADYVGKKFALTHSKVITSSLTDYNTGETVPYKYNDIWTVEDVKVIKGVNSNKYFLMLALKNSAGNVITIAPNSILLVDKKTYDDFVKKYGVAMVKSAFEGDLKVGMHESLVRHVTKHYVKKDNLTIAKTSKGEEWTIHASSKTIYINFNTSKKLTSWREEDPQETKMRVKVTATPK